MLKLIGRMLYRNSVNGRVRPGPVCATNVETFASEGAAGAFAHQSLDLTRDRWAIRPR
jgi:hypothetical protein